MISDGEEFNCPADNSNLFILNVDDGDYPIAMNDSSASPS
jgi:hypothetical protein